MIYIVNGYDLVPLRLEQVTLADVQNVVQPPSSDHTFALQQLVSVTVTRADSDSALQPVKART